LKKKTLKKYEHIIQVKSTFTMWTILYLFCYQLFVLSFIHLLIL